MHLPRLQWQNPKTPHPMSSLLLLSYVQIFYYMQPYYNYVSHANSRLFARSDFWYWHRSAKCVHVFGNCIVVRTICRAKLWELWLCLGLINNKKQRKKNETKWKKKKKKDTANVNKTAGPKGGLAYGKNVCTNEWELLWCSDIGFRIWWDRLSDWLLIKPDQIGRSMRLFLFEGTTICMYVNVV